MYPTFPSVSAWESEAAFPSQAYSAPSSQDTEEKVTLVAPPVTRCPYHTHSPGLPLPS